jgi:hypothetical protein
VDGGAGSRMERDGAMASEVMRCLGKEEGGVRRETKGICGKKERIKKLLCHALILEIDTHRPPLNTISFNWTLVAIPFDTHGHGRSVRGPPWTCPITA